MATRISLHKDTSGTPNWALYWHDYWHHELSKPVGAMDSALPRGRRSRRHAWDQEPNGGKLSRVFCDATKKYLGDNGLDPDDIDKVMQILSQYQADDADPEIPVWPPRGVIDQPADYPMGHQDSKRGAQDAARRAATQALLAHDKAMAVDRVLDQRTASERDFARRWPEIARIKRIG